MPGRSRPPTGWNVQDFASSFFNPHPEEITVTMKMVSDDPKFLFANGQVGTYTKTYKLRPMQGDDGQHLHRFTHLRKARVACGTR